MASFTEWLLTRQETPGFLRTEQSSRWLGILGTQLDVVTEALIRARCTTWPLHPNCPEDALALLGSERALPRYPSETLPSYRQRLVDAWDTWSTAGSRTQLIQALEDWGFGAGSVHIVSNEDWGSAEDFTDPPNTLPGWASPSQDDEAAKWARFWIYVESTGHNFTAANLFNDGTEFNDGSVFGVGGITRQEVVDLQQLIELFRPAHELPMAIVFLLDASSGFTAPDVFSGDTARIDLD